MRPHTYGDWKEIDKGKLTHVDRSVDVVDYIAGNRPDVRFVAECLSDEVPEEDRRAVAQGKITSTGLPGRRWKPLVHGVEATPGIRALAAARNGSETDDTADTADELWTVVTLAAPDQHALLDDTMGPRWQCVNADDGAHAARLVRAGGVRGVFVAANVAHAAAAGEIAAVVSAGANIPMFALVTEWTSDVQDGLLALSRCGIRRVFDLSPTTQEQELRNLLATRDSAIQQHIEAALLAALSGAPHGTRVFFRRLVRSAPHTTNMRQFARELATSAGALKSRFSRAGLPSPRQYLAGVRLLYASALLSETHAPLAPVVAALGYSSPEHFRQHVRTVTGMSAYELENDHTLDELIRKYCTDLIVAFQPQLARIDLTVAHSPDRLRLVAGRGRRHDKPALRRTG
jgi:AraC-like DNA-binding protein